MAVVLIRPTSACSVKSQMVASVGGVTAPGAEAETAAAARADRAGHRAAGIAPDRGAVQPDHVLGIEGRQPLGHHRLALKQAFEVGQQQARCGFKPG